MKYDEAAEPVELSHLQDTVLLDEMYSISASRFLGNSEMMLGSEEEEANEKFDQLLKLEGVWSQAEEEDEH